MKFCLEAFFCVKTYSVLLVGDFRSPYEPAQLEPKQQRHREITGMVFDTTELSSTFLSDHLLI